MRTLLTTRGWSTVSEGGGREWQEDSRANLAGLMGQGEVCRFILVPGGGQGVVGPIHSHQIVEDRGQGDPLRDSHFVCPLQVSSAPSLGETESQMAGAPEPTLLAGVPLPEPVSSSLVVFFPLLYETQMLAGQVPSQLRSYEQHGP